MIIRFMRLESDVQHIPYTLIDLINNVTLQISKKIKEKKKKE